MTRLSPEEVDRFLEGLFVDPDPAMDSVVAESRRAGLAEIAVSPLQGKFLMILAAAIGARRILEIGALGGYSTLWLARALSPGGRIVTLDIDPASVETVHINAAACGFSEQVVVIEGPALTSLDAIIAAGEPPFDFIFIDADKNNYPAYLDRSLALSRPGTVIIADNVVRKGAVADAASNDSMAAGVRNFLKQAKATPGLSTSVIQTVGAKGHDGFSISRVH